MIGTKCTNELCKGDRFVKGYCYQCYYTKMHSEEIIKKYMSENGKKSQKLYPLTSKRAKEIAKMRRKKL